MQAAVLHGREEFVLAERPRPDPAAGEALVRIDRVGICGSDLHYYRDGRNGDNRLETPTVLGHESAGTVAETGDGVEGVAAGDRVAVEPGVPCGDCTRCARGDYHLCASMRFMGSPPDDGALAEYVAWPADRVHPLPGGVSTRAGALCEPLGVALHAVRRAGVGNGDAVFVSGCGPIGLLVTAAARVAGAGAIVTTDVVPAKLALAERLGATHTVDVRESEPATTVESVTEDGVDVALECSGAAAAVEGLPALVRRGGDLVFVGLPAEPTLPVDVFDLIDGELDVRGSFRFRGTYPRAIDLLERGAVDAEALIAFEAPLADVDAAFERASDPSVVKGMIDVGAGSVADDR